MPSLFPVAQQQAAGVLPVLQAEIAKSLASVGMKRASEEAKDRLAQRQARAAVALVRLGHADLVWPLLRHSADPRLRSFIVNWLEPAGGRPEASSPPSSTGLDPAPASTPSAAPGQPEHGRHPLPPRDLDRRALILALGTYGAEDLLSRRARAADPRLLDLYATTPTPASTARPNGPCGSGSKTKLKAADAELSRLKDPGRAPLVRQQPGTDVRHHRGPGRVPHGLTARMSRIGYDETPHRRVISHRFAIADQGGDRRAISRVRRDRTNRPKSSTMAETTGTVPIRKAR